VNAFLSSVSPKPQFAENVSWLKMVGDGFAHATGDGNAFTKTTRFAQIMREYNVLNLSPEMPLEVKLWHVNHAKFIIVTYGGTLYSLMINRRVQFPFMQYMLVLHHPGYGTSRPDVGNCRRPDGREEHITHGEWMFHDHVVDPRIRALPALPVSNLTVKCLFTDSVDAITPDDLDYSKWRVRKHPEC
jgi:hypothetical protein